MSAKKDKTGFTLLELIVTITLLIVMVLMLSNLFSLLTDTINRGRTQARKDETARMLLDVIEQDISQAVIRTNMAFRIHQVAGNEALYFISTAVRRKRENLPRDTGPMRLRTARTLSTGQGLVPEFNQRIIIESAIGSGNPDSSELNSLLRLSDIYHSSNNPTANDFISIHHSLRMGKGVFDYTTPLSDLSGTQHSIMPTFLSLTINHDLDSNFNSNRPADPMDLPRTIDVTLGLISAKDMAQAMRLYNAQGPTAGNDHLNRKEQIYTRRVFMRNRGPHLIHF
jgi:type II secretory pathway pseudopilin PulG